MKDFLLRVGLAFVVTLTVFALRSRPSESTVEDSRNVSSTATTMEQGGQLSAAIAQQ
jgi:hypothetical protein